MPGIPCLAHSRIMGKLHSTCHSQCFLLLEKMSLHFVGTEIYFLTGPENGSSGFPLPQSYSGDWKWRLWRRTFRWFSGESLSLGILCSAKPVFFTLIWPNFPLSPIAFVHIMIILLGEFQLKIFWKDSHFMITITSWKEKISSKLVKSALIRTCMQRKWKLIPGDFKMTGYIILFQLILSFLIVMLFLFVNI